MKIRGRLLQAEYLVDDNKPEAEIDISAEELVSQITLAECADIYNFALQSKISSMKNAGLSVPTKAPPECDCEIPQYWIDTLNKIDFGDTTITPYEHNHLIQIGSFLGRLKNKPKALPWTEGFLTGWKARCNEISPKAPPEPQYCTCKPDRMGQLPMTPEGLCGKCGKLILIKPTCEPEIAPNHCGDEDCPFCEEEIEELDWEVMKPRPNEPYENWMKRCVEEMNKLVRSLIRWTKREG